MSKEQLLQLLPLPDDELQQVLDYASTLSKAEAAEHFTNLLGDSPQVVEFISTFNARRAEPAPSPSPPPPPAASPAQSSEVDAVPKHRPRNKDQRKKNKNAIHTPPPRPVASFALAPGTVYNKRDQQEEYMSGKPGASASSSGSSSRGRAPAQAAQQPKPPPSSASAGTLVSELGLPKSKGKSKSASTPGAPSRSQGGAAKVSITGGVPMHGSSTVLADLDQAIRSLEMTTNPTHESNTAAGVAARRCNCVATRHPLLEAAPNCLNCGKVVCVKEGPGPCTFCGRPLLSAGEVRDMIKELRAERGRERMAADREAHRRRGGGVGGSSSGGSGVWDAGAGAGADEPSVAEAMAALQHRDKLLGFQAQNARRTVVRDEAADFDPSLAGASMWASPEERALALKRQQRLLREMEWNARPEYEKRQQVVSIDLSGRKVLRKTVRVERPPSPDSDGDGDGGADAFGDGGTHGSRAHGGAFSRNPLLGGLIRPVYDAKGKEKELEGRKDRPSRWRRVQDDLDDNEAVILDGGVYGAGANPEALAGTAGDEPGCG